MRMEETKMTNQITYTKTKSGYYIPNITVPECKPIGKYGMMCRSHIKNYRSVFYSMLMMTGKLNDYLHDVDQHAEELKAMLLPKYKAQYGITEQLKADNQMEWVRRMNTVTAQIEEVILNDIVYGGVER
jgi:hypothetical protein